MDLPINRGGQHQMHGLGHDKARPLNTRLVNLDGRLRRRVPFERWLIKPSSQPVQPAFSSLSGPHCPKARRRVALGLGALGISGGPGSGTLPFLRSAVGTHRANLSAISRAIGNFGIVGDFPTVMPLDYCDVLAVAAILLGVAVLCGIVYIYDVSRQTVQDDTHAEAHLSSQQNP